MRVTRANRYNVVLGEVWIPMKLTQRAAVQMYTSWWWSFHASYPFGAMTADSEEIVIQVPWIKTARIKRNDIQDLKRLSGWPGVFRWFVMPGIKIVHSNPTEPSCINVRVPDIGRLQEGLALHGYTISS